MSDPMNTRPMIERLARFPGVLAACTAGLPEADARWRPESGPGPHDVRCDACPLADVFGCTGVEFTGRG